MQQSTKEHPQLKHKSWPSEFTEAPMSSTRDPSEDSVKSLMQPTRHAAFMKNKKRNESSNWMQQATMVGPNIQPMNYGSGPVQSFVDDKIDFSAYEIGKKNFQNFVPGDTNLPAGAYYDTPAYIDPSTGKVINYDLPSVNRSMQQPQQQIKILEVNMGPKMQSSREAPKVAPMQQPCNNPNCTGCGRK